MIASQRIPTPGEIADVAAARGRSSRMPWAWEGLAGLWLPMAGPQGGRLVDWSGFRHHGTLTNMTPATDWVPSRHGYALDLDGVNDFVACGSLAQQSGSVWLPFTTMILLRRNSSPASLEGAYNLSNSGHQLFIYSDGDLAYGDAGETWKWEVLNCNAITDPTRWYRIVCRSTTSTSMDFFVDGAYVGSITSSFVMEFPWDNVRLGMYMPGYPSYNWSGQIGDFALWTGRALTNKQIIQLSADPRGLITAGRRVSTFYAPAAGGSAIPALTRYYRNRRCA